MRSNNCDYWDKKFEKIPRKKKDKKVRLRQLRGITNRNNRKFTNGDTPH